MTDGTAPDPQGDPTTEPRCTAVTDNGRGIVFHCVKPAHPDNPDQHWMQRDELAERRSRRGES